MSIKKILTALQELNRNMSLRNKMVIAFLFLTLLPSTVIAYMSFYNSKAIIKKKIFNYNSDILNEVSKNIEFRLYEIDQLTIMLFTNPDLQRELIEINQTKYKATDEYWKITVKKHIEELLYRSTYTRDYIVSVTILLNNNELISTNPEAFAFTDNEKKAVNARDGSLVWLGVHHNDISVARVLYDLKRQEKIGYLYIAIKEAEINQIYNKIGFYKKGDLYIVNSQGLIISHKNKSMLNRPTIYKNFPNNEYGCFISKKAGKECYITYHKIEGSDWKIISIIPTVKYEREIILLKKEIILIAVICWALATLFSFILSSGISKPLLKLSRMMTQVGQGNFNIYFPYHSKNEIGILSRYFNKMVKRIDTLINAVYQQKLLNQKAELKSLSMQINPHFIYNTLESINWLARIKGVDEVGKMAKALGDFMRSNIGAAEFISLENELKNLNNYLLIQKYRYGNKFEAKVKVSPEILSIKIPKFILQPIVENSIIHGIEKMIGDGKLEIEGYQEKEAIIITIKDNGVGMDQSKIKNIFGQNSYSDDHAGIGLKNVDRRIKLYYGQDYGISITSNLGAGTEVTVRIGIAIHGG